MCAYLKMCSLLQICVQYCIDVAYVVEIKLNSIQFNTTAAVFRFWCGRLGTAVTHVSSLRTLTRLAFVPAALIVPFSLKSEVGALLHP